MRAYGIYWRRDERCLVDDMEAKNQSKAEIYYHNFETISGGEIFLFFIAMLAKYWRPQGNKSLQKLIARQRK